jgi:MFS family permease
LIPIFMYDNLKLTGLEMGIVMGAGTVVTALLLRPLGSMSDKLSRRWMVIFGGSMTALLSFCPPVAQSFGHLLALSIAIGMFRVVSLPASSALLVQEGNLYGMGLAMGIFNGAMNSGTVLAPLAGGFALGCFGIKAIFYGGAFLGLIGIVFFYFCTWPVANPRQRRSDQDLDFRNDSLLRPAPVSGGCQRSEGAHLVCLPQARLRVFQRHPRNCRSNLE